MASMSMPTFGSLEGDWGIPEGQRRVNEVGSNAVTGYLVS